MEVYLKNKNLPLHNHLNANKVMLQVHYTLTDLDTNPHQLRS